MINTLMALILGLLILSKPTPVILSIGSNNPYMENTLTISTTLNPVTGSVFKILMPTYDNNKEFSKYKCD
jgi:hypothetical protein